MKLLTELGITTVSIILMEHNQGAIDLAKNPVAHAQKKHIDI